MIVTWRLDMRANGAKATAKPAEYNPTLNNTSRKIRGLLFCGCFTIETAKVRNNIPAQMGMLI